MMSDLVEFFGYALLVGCAGLLLLVTAEAVGRYLGRLSMSYRPPDSFDPGGAVVFDQDSGLPRWAAEGQAVRWKFDQRFIVLHAPGHVDHRRWVRAPWVDNLSAPENLLVTATEIDIWGQPVTFRPSPFFDVAEDGAHAQVWAFEDTTMESLRDEPEYKEVTP